MNHKFLKHGRTMTLDSEVVSVHGRDLCGKCTSLCRSKCHVSSLELYGAVRSCSEMFCGHDSLTHLIHPSQVGCDDGTQLHGNSGCPGGALVRDSMPRMLQQVLVFKVGQDFAGFYREFIVIIGFQGEKAWKTYAHYIQTSFRRCSVESLSHAR